MSKMMPIAELTFDVRNPRLSEFELGNSPSDREVMEVLWEAMDVREVMLSIAASGYFQHEPLIVAQEDGKNIVVEGNRRLAAVRVLLDPTLVEATDIPALGQNAKQELRRLPAIIRTREDAWQYIGFKHVNGPAKWSSYAKSQYIARVHREYGVCLEDIARQIGDTHKTVQRLFRGMMVMEQAERWNLFDREDRWFRHLSFSHLYVGLGYSGISGFIGLTSEADEDPEPVPADKKEELQELCLWLYGSRKEEIRPVVESPDPDLRRLDRVVANREAAAALRAGTGLSYAFEVSGRRRMSSRSPCTPPRETWRRFTACCPPGTTDPGSCSRSRRTWRTSPMTSMRRWNARAVLAEGGEPERRADVQVARGSVGRCA